MNNEKKGVSYGKLIKSNNSMDKCRPNYHISTLIMC